MSDFMDMQQLREEFANWAVGEPFQNAFDIMQLLTDPTPITEAGLLGLGYMQSKQFSSLWFSDDSPTVQKNRNGTWELNSVDGCIKTIGQLRMLLLSVEG